jgi:hypothetical protein
MLHQIRVACYLSQVLIKDETVQRAGCVVVYYGIGQSSISNSRARSLLHCWRSMPLNVCARHFCYDHVGIQSGVQLIGSLLHPFHAMRFRVHFGTSTECLYNLMTYGIPRDSIPILDEDAGTVDVAFHSCLLDALVVREQVDREGRSQQQGTAMDELQPYDAQLDRNSWNIMVDPEGGDALPPELLWSLASTSLTESTTATAANGSNHTAAPIPATAPSGGGFIVNNNHDAIPSNATSNTRHEATRASSFLILVPGPEDVIMGRGRHNKNKPGNRKLTKMLEDYFEGYEAADKFQKTVIAQHVLTAMTESGSRFLIRESPPSSEGGGGGDRGGGMSARNGTAKRGVWVQVTQERARDKIAHDFRNLRRPDAKKHKPARGDDLLDDQQWKTTPTNNKRALPLEGGMGLGNMSQQQDSQHQEPHKEQKLSDSVNRYAASYFS